MSLKLVHICNIFLAKMLATATDYLLALATLGDATKNRNDPISSVPLPKVAKVAKVTKVAKVVRQVGTLLLVLTH